MNAEISNEIFKRRPVRDFLRLYPSDRWKELIPDIFEIGVLNLKNSFGTLKFSKTQIKDILLDLRNYKPNEEEININNMNNDINYEEQNNNEYEEDYNNNNEEEEYLENEDDNNVNNYNMNNNGNNIKNNQNKEKEDMKERMANAEVFIPDENKIGIKVNYNRPKIAYNSTMEEIREKNIENKRNIGYTESKIKYQIMNDKRNHQMRKRKISDDNNYNNDNDGNFSFKKDKNIKEKKEKNLNKNYLINFDKNLNPENPIEMQKKNINYNYNIFNNNNNEMNNNYNNDFNEENIFNSFKNNINNYDNSNSFNNNDDNYNNQKVQNHLNNYKINMLNIPNYGFQRNNLNNN